MYSTFLPCTSYHFVSKIFVDANLNVALRSCVSRSDMGAYHWGRRRLSFGRDCGEEAPRSDRTHSVNAGVQDEGRKLGTQLFLFQIHPKLAAAKDQA